MSYYRLVHYITSSSLTELQNRKILEELQLKKQMLLKQGVAPALNSSLATSPTGSTSNPVSIYLQYYLFYRGTIVYFSLLMIYILN